VQGNITHALPFPDGMLIASSRRKLVLSEQLNENHRQFTAMNVLDDLIFVSMP
jgi:hypothetical protein